jgi:hypothetical protein
VTIKRKVIGISPGFSFDIKEEGEISTFHAKWGHTQSEAYSNILEVMAYKILECLEVGPEMFPCTGPMPAYSGLERQSITSLDKQNKYALWISRDVTC